MMGHVNFRTERSRTVNGIGWNVEELLSTGWRATGPIYPTKIEAHAALDAMPKGNVELRVYEALK
jgi:hypothetical protein